MNSSTPKVGMLADHKSMTLDPQPVAEVSDDGTRIRLNIRGQKTDWIAAKDHLFKEAGTPIDTEAEACLQARAEAIAGRVLAQRQEAARHVLWHNGDYRGARPGSFTEKLLDAWARADMTNSAALAEAFPMLGQAVSISSTQGSDALAEWAAIK